MNTDAQFTRALVLSVPVGILLAASATLILRRRVLSSFLQLLGASCFTIVVLAHVCEAFHLLPSVGWGLDRSLGHYLDAGGIVLGLAFFPIGYLIHAINLEPQRKKRFLDREQ